MQASVGTGTETTKIKQKKLHNILLQDWCVLLCIKVFAMSEALQSIMLLSQNKLVLQSSVSSIFGAR